MLARLSTRRRQCQCAIDVARLAICLASWRSRSSPAPTRPIAFADVAAALGVDFVHAGSPTTEKYLVETMGGGVAVLDYDNDGRLDLFFVNGAALADPMTRGVFARTSATRAFTIDSIARTPTAVSTT